MVLHHPGNNGGNRTVFEKSLLIKGVRLSSFPNIARDAAGIRLHERATGGPMTTQPVERASTPGPIAQILHAQMVWQRMCWDLAAANFGMGWRIATSLPHVVKPRHCHDGHDQLEVPSDIAENEHALFA